MKLLIKSAGIFLYISFALPAYLFANFGEDTDFNSVAVPLAQSAAAWGDYTNDGAWDLITVGRDSEGERRTIIYKNNGSSFQKIENHGIRGIALENRHFGNIVWGDMDNSGTLDLVIAGHDGTGQKVWIYKNNNGYFNLMQELSDIGAGSVETIDFNNNGRMDLVVGPVSADSKPVLYINTAEEFVSKEAGFNTNISIENLGQADLNNNGWTDLIGIGQDEDDNPVTVIYENQDGESFKENISTGENNIIEEGFALGSLIAGDYNNSGLIDLVISGIVSREPDTPETVVYTNKTQPGGEINFSSSTFSFPGVYNSNLAFGDYNNDGRLDLAVLGAEEEITGPFHLKIYKGTDTFDSYIDIGNSVGVEGLQRGAVSWADYNNSRALDLAVLGEDDTDDPVTKLLKNNVDSAPYDENNLPPQVESFATRYFDGTLYIMWNDPKVPDFETPTSGLYYNFRVGTSSGADNLVPMSYGSPLMGNYLTKVTSDTIDVPDRINVSNHRHVRAMNISGSDYYWAVQTIDTGLGYSWANPDYSGWSEQQVFVDTSPPVGYPSRPEIPGEFIYERDIEFVIDKGSSRDPETGIYGAYIEIEEDGEVIFSEEIWSEGEPPVWSETGRWMYNYRGEYNKTYRIRCKARHGFTEPSLATETYKTGQFSGESDEYVLWHPESKHYTLDGPYSGWSEWSGEVTPVELITVDNNFIREPGVQFARINYVAEESGNIKLRIFNIRGELVKSLMDGYVKKGSGSKKWYGLTNTGHYAASGTYFVNIQINGSEDTEKIIIIK